jgi:nitroreductase
MELMDVLRSRYSCRAYRPEPVEEEKFDRVLEAAVLAPTACNRQPFQVVVIRTPGREADLKRVYPKDWFWQAPLVLAVVGIPAQAWVRKDQRAYLDVDAAIAMDHMVLAAADQGLGTCWVAAFDAQAAREVLGLPDDVEPLLFSPLGYPADQRSPKPRKARGQLVRYDRW